MTEQLVYLSELEDFVAALNSAGSGVTDDVTERVIHSMGDEVANLARYYAPKDTWELANSIHAVHGPMESRVVADAPHAAYVEFGTWSHNVIRPQSGTYEIRPKNAKALKFKGRDGRPVFTQVVNHPGIKPQPYLGRANAEIMDRFSEGVAKVGITLLMVGA
jgi:hypothetical protein